MTYCESVHALNISALSDTCTLLFPQEGNSPLQLAAYGGHLDTVKFLLQQGADLSLCDKVSVIVNWYSVLLLVVVWSQLNCCVL